MATGGRSAISEGKERGRGQTVVLLFSLNTDPTIGGVREGGEGGYKSQARVNTPERSIGSLRLSAKRVFRQFLPSSPRLSPIPFPLVLLPSFPFSRPARRVDPWIRKGIEAISAGADRRIDRALFLFSRRSGYRRITRFFSPQISQPIFYARRS